MYSYQIQSHQCHLQVYSVNSSSKTTVLFLHGGPGSGAKAMMDLPAFQELSTQYHCLYFDQRGSGLSQYRLSDNISVDTIVQDVITVLLDAKARWHSNRFILWGGSFGGYLACLCLEKFPDLFESVILSSPAMTFNREQSLAFYHRMADQYQQRMPVTIQNTSDILCDLSPEEFFQISEIRDFIFSKNNPSNSLKHICAMSSWFYQHPFPNFFQNIHIPMLIMQGKDDLICDYQNIDNELKTHSSNISYLLYDECGHEVFTDQKDEFIKEINKFIEKRAVTTKSFLTI